MSPKPVDMKAAAEELVERSRKAQGLPRHITDEAVLRKIATIVASAPPLTPEQVTRIKDLLPSSKRQQP